MLAGYRNPDSDSNLRDFTKEKRLVSTAETGLRKREKKIAVVFLPEKKRE
jgi:hypothetical protein